jgi:hypothetical protein
LALSKAPTADEGEACGEPPRASEREGAAQGGALGEPNSKAAVQDEGAGESAADVAEAEGEALPQTLVDAERATREPLAAPEPNAASRAQRAAALLLPATRESVQLPLPLPAEPDSKGE